MSDHYGLGSSHYAWSAGMDASFIDPLIVKPHTSWRGTRGVRVAFAGEEAFDEEDDDSFFDDDLDEFGAVLASEADDLFSEMDADLDDELYGRLYMGAKYHELSHASPGDVGALIGRSGGSGYRGGRPVFGANISMGPLQYEGSEWATFFIGAGALLVLGKGMGAW